MKKIAAQCILLLTFIFLISCGKGVSLNAGGSIDRGGQRAPVGLKEPPPSKACNGSAPKNASIMGETWMLTQTAGNLTLVTGLYVEDNQTTLTVTCSAPNAQPLIASVKASSTFDSSTLKHAAAGPKTVGAPRTGMCTSSLDSNPSGYKLMGSCLLINLNGQNHYFVRASSLFLNF